MLGTPAVFYKRVFDDSIGESVMGSVPAQQLPRESDPSQLARIIREALKTTAKTPRTLESPGPALVQRSRADLQEASVSASGGRAADDRGIENHVGARSRQWELMKLFVSDQDRRSTDPPVQRVARGYSRSWWLI